MLSPEEYELIDFGRDRKLERFGEYLLDRPSPAAESVRPQHEDAWADADARYLRKGSGQGVWKPHDALPESWTIDCGDFRLELRSTEFGHLGVFPEHAACWNWVGKQIHRAKRKLRVLNLFAYTGAATLAAAAAGAEVVHVDSAKNIVRRARRNAEISGLDEAPIRWIPEDALRFVTREQKRGNRYDAVILDPPTYGHGPKGEVWKINRHLPELLDRCADLTRDQLAFVHLSCHSPGFGGADLQAALLGSFFSGSCQAGAGAGSMTLSTRDGRQLHCGNFARWPAR